VTLPHDLDAASLFLITDVAERARCLAQAAHAGQLDKAGNDYFESHLVDVCRRVVSYGGDIDEQAAAWLHDVVEDTAVTELDLLASGFSDKTLLMVHLMTNQEAEDPEVYYARLRAYEPARRLKLDADMASNSDPDRLALLDEVGRARLNAKYAKGKALLVVDLAT
jgi:(p)ppGpp synthase/HD superfamily hydrolase